MAAVQNRRVADLTGDREAYGRWVENAVGAHFLRAGLEVFYWRERDLEVDFVVRVGRATLAVEVGVGKKKKSAELLERLARKQGWAKTLVVGSGGVELGQFLKSDPQMWLS